jgi:RND family efflux transporter MFP subunit
MEAVMMRAERRQVHAKRLSVGMALVVALAAAAWGEGSHMGSGTPGMVMTGPNGEMILTGATEPVAKVDVPASLRGVLAEVNVKEGQAVKKGDQLAKLDDAMQVQEVELARLEAEQMSEIHGAENQVEFAKNEYDSFKGPPPRGSVSEIRQKELAYKQANLSLEVQKDRRKQDQVKLKAQEITLERMTLRSPIDGYVLRVYKEAGEQTDEGPVITVVQTIRLNAVFFLPKDLFGKLSVGDTVNLGFDGGIARPGKVVAVDPAMVAGLFRVKLEVDNADARIPAGISATWVWGKK